MAKNRNKKDNKKGADSMEISTHTTDANPPQAMDTSEVADSNPALGVMSSRKMKKTAAQTRRSKNIRKQKAIEKAISKSEKSEEKISKGKSKVSRIQSAKSLYD
ncbi:uncharacterized protein LOC131236405 isoform X1 [Magnolia sinica]|uniref:uncharacterized protein LOC131236405 isoform X1 n=1 Tax=Magnolia sinica TaxID=86752 RepID=UPI002657E00C|nr:uncharacterized protein LOC131236405 isoform X1 [Magnolia sinica]